MVLGLKHIGSNVQEDLALNGRDNVVAKRHTKSKSENSNIKSNSKDYVEQRHARR